MFSISGIFSGLDVNTLVDTLVEAERAPSEARYARQEQAYSVELSALGLLSSALSNFESQVESLSNISDFNSRTGSSSDDELLSVSTTSSAVAGSYQFYVDQLASRHQLTSNGFADDADFGAGTASFTINGESFSIDVVAGAASLSDIRDAINDAEDNTGVKATIINDGNQQRLLLTSAETGAANAITADFSGITGGTATLNTFTDLQAAKDAQIRFGSDASAITITSSDNTFENVVDGVTLNLKAISSNPVTVDVALDKSSVKSSVQSFVNAYNSLKSTLDQLTDFNGESAGPLNGDALTRSLESQIRREISELFGEDGDSLRALGDIGIKTTREGTLEIDTPALDNALASNFDDMATIFAGDNGLMVRLQSTLEPYLGSDGTISSREERLNEGLRDIEDNRADLELRLERVREYHQNQFLAMESLLASLNGTSQWLTNNLNSLNNNNSNN